MIEVRNSGLQAREVEAPRNRQTLPIRIRFGTSKPKNCHTLRQHAVYSDGADRPPAEDLRCVPVRAGVRDAARASLSPEQDGNGCVGNRRETIGEGETNWSGGKR